MSQLRGMTPFLARVLLVVVASWGLACGPGRAELNIDITRGVVEPIPIAIADFAGEQPFGRDVAAVVTADLARSGLFKPIGQSAFVQRDLTLDGIPRFADWRVINAQALVHGSAGLAPDGRLSVKFRLWDVFAGQNLVGQEYLTTPANWRSVGHKIADAIYKRITGEDGYFDTRIVYVAETGPLARRVKRLAIMDQDGANHAYLTDGSSLVLTPRFSPTSQDVTFMAYRGGPPSVFLMNLETGRQQPVGNFPGMSFAPRFSSDGGTLVFSMAKDGNTEIYDMDLRSRAVRQLTRHSAIDTSPSFAPDNRLIVFNSDRGGTQQLYVMSADGSDVRRISFADGRYATPVWSPRGDLIAFTKLSGGRFAVGVMRPDGSGERVIAEGFRVEGPTWAPNGRVLLYFQRDPADAGGAGGRSRLMSVDVTGQNRREVPTPGDASDPAWSPVLR
jgi:TolB protein